MTPRLPGIEQREGQDPAALEAWLREHLHASSILALLSEPTRDPPEPGAPCGTALYTWTTPEGWQVTLEAGFHYVGQGEDRPQEGPWALGRIVRGDGHHLESEGLGEASVAAENLAFVIREMRLKQPHWRWPEFYGLHCDEDPAAPWPVVVPDLHGRADLLDAVTAAYPDRHLILLGDYVDRGPDSRGVIARVRDLVTRGRATALVGNHDELMICAVLDGDGAAQSCWLHNGGRETLEAYGGDHAALRDDAQWMREHLRLDLQYNGYLFTHAGRPMPGDTRHEQLWLRPDDRPQPPLPEGLHTSVHGHTVMSVPRLESSGRTRAWYLDTGAVRTGVLTVLDLETQQPVEIRAPM